MTRKFAAAMIVYSVLAVVAAFWIKGTPRIAVWILLGGLALKTVIARAGGLD